MTRTYTIRDLSQYFAVSGHTVLAWIHQGELRATDVSPKRGGRPKWRITAEAVEAFEVSRMPSPPPEPRRRGRRKQEASVVEYY